MLRKLVSNQTYPACRYGMNALVLDSSFTPCVQSVKFSKRLLSTSDNNKPPEGTNAESLDNGQLWAWIPPRDKVHLHDVKEKYQIPVIKRQLIKPDEVKQYLENNGADKVIILKLPESLDNITHFVIANASSTRLIRQLGETIVERLKQRELFQVLGTQGVEGSRHDDWQLVDCHTFLVHLMLPTAREAIDLEGHWSGATRPCLVYSKNPKELDRQMDALLSKYPNKSDLVSMTVDVEDVEEEDYFDRPIKTL